MVTVTPSSHTDILTGDPLTTDEALAYYDDLPAIDIDFMLGRWKGSEVRAGHPAEGLLEAVGWYGKLFIDEDTVHPLLFYRAENRLFAVNPRRIPMNLTNTPVGRLTGLAGLLPLVRPFIATKKAKARLRMVTYRGVCSAAMCYDELPIIDCFRKVDDNTVLGVMDQKGSPIPYFFLLERDDDSPMRLDL